MKSNLYKETNNNQSGKIQRYRPGKVPDWAKQNQNSVAQNTKTQNEIYKGYTADNAGVIIDTSKGIIEAANIVQNNKNDNNDGKK